MPRLVKGGKWVFGWVLIQDGGLIRIPPEAWQEYGFQAGEEAIFIRGSKTSGGFSVAMPEKLNRLPGGDLGEREIGRSHFGDGTITLPQGLAISPGSRLLVGRGSGLALGFIRQGPIVEEALQHPELEEF